MQLGPVVCCKFATEFGLRESFMDRLLNRFPYTRDIEGFPQTGGYDPRLVTKLLYNYRSLPGVLVLPNSMFYFSELRPTVRINAEILYGSLLTFFNRFQQTTVSRLSCYLNLKNFSQREMEINRLLLCFMV